MKSQKFSTEHNFTISTKCLSFLLPVSDTNFEVTLVQKLMDGLHEILYLVAFSSEYSGVVRNLLFL